jgi:carboxyl-terminal processing protease
VATAAVAGLLLLHTPARAVSPRTFPGAKPKDLLLLAREAEAKGKWARACEIYDDLVRIDRGRSDYRRGFRRCFRRYQQMKRFLDPSYRKMTSRKAGLTYSDAILLYRRILEGLQQHHVDKSRAVAKRLYQRGLEEFRFALENEVFQRLLVNPKEFTRPGEKKKAVERFLAKLKKMWAGNSIRSVAQAEDALRGVAMAAQKPVKFGGLNLSATSVVLEFACGACTALDEYTFYLTPSQLAKMKAALAADKFIGIGIELCLRSEKLVVSKVLRGSPADGKLQVLDEVTRIGKRSTTDLTPEEAMDLLKGEVGTTVEIEFIRGMQGAELVVVKREKLTPRSVEYGWLWQKVDMAMADEKTDFGYLQINSFIKTTPQELDEAIAALKDGGVRGLILDLRGNSGGSLKAALDCARRFLSNGVIVSTRTNDGKLVKHYVRNGSAVVPWTSVPLVVLVDGDTASSAEVLAGALKENKRAKLVGQTTFGKVCSQKVYQLTAVRTVVGAVRITVARFLSPNGQPYSGRGIVPDVAAERHIGLNQADDNQLFEAKRTLKESMAPPM